MKRERLIPLALAASSVLAIAACSSDPTSGGNSTPRATATPTTEPGSEPGTSGPRSRPQGFGSGHLEFFGDCDALLASMRDIASDRVTAWGLGGGPYWYGDDAVMAREGAAVDMDTSAPTAAPAPDSAGSDGGGFSGTNTQEVGVDEGDIVETDGRFVYAANQDGVRVVSVSDARVVATIELSSGSHQLLLDDSRLLVATQSWTGSPDTIVSLYDVADPASPQLLRRSHLEGSVVATRAIDGIARLVISTSFDQRLPFVQPNEFGFDEDSALAENTQIIAESSVEDWLPRWFDERGDGSFGEMAPILSCEDVGSPDEFSGLGLTWIASIDTQGEGTPIGAAGVVSSGDTVYASTDNLYIATQAWDWQWRPLPIEDDVAAAPVPDVAVDGPAPEPAPEVAPLTPDPVTTESATTEPATTDPETTRPATTEPAATTPDTTPDIREPEPTSPPTTEPEPEPTDTTAPKSLEDYSSPPTFIHQFSLDAGTGATYIASGAVEGRLLNQFAMSEHNGDLRVATTNDNWDRFGDQSESTVYVLRPNGTDLQQISSIGGLGKGERIYAVRFLGDVGYVVTFRQIDPLYVLDLSDPTHPVLDGELKIPGYSAYLHPVGEGLLLGVGQDATLEGRTQGTKLSLFDVSDPTNPREISSLPIGGYSEVEWDHKAFLFWPEDGTIVLPVSPGWNDCGIADVCLAGELKGSAGGAVVAELAGRELRARGVITHGANRTSGCWNPLQRSIAIGSELVTVGFDSMAFSDRSTLDERATVRWGSPEDYGCFWYVD